jgi:hypothetical protein
LIEIIKQRPSDGESVEEWMREEETKTGKFRLLLMHFEREKQCAGPGHMYSIRNISP